MVMSIAFSSKANGIFISCLCICLSKRKKRKPEKKGSGFCNFFCAALFVPQNDTHAVALILQRVPRTQMSCFWTLWLYFLHKLNTVVGWCLSATHANFSHNTIAEKLCSQTYCGFMQRLKIASSSRSELVQFFIQCFSSYYFFSF